MDRMKCRSLGRHSQSNYAGRHVVANCQMASRMGSFACRVRHSRDHSKGSDASVMSATNGSRPGAGCRRRAGFGWRLLGRRVSLGKSGQLDDLLRQGPTQVVRHGRSQAKPAEGKNVPPEQTSGGPTRLKFKTTTPLRKTRRRALPDSLRATLSYKFTSGPCRRVRTRRLRVRVEKKMLVESELLRE